MSQSSSTISSGSVSSAIGPMSSICRMAYLRHFPSGAIPMTRSASSAPYLCSSVISPGSSSLSPAAFAFM